MAIGFVLSKCPDWVCFVKTAVPITAATSNAIADVHGRGLHSFAPIHLSNSQRLRRPAALTRLGAPTMSAFVPLSWGIADVERADQANRFYEYTLSSTQSMHPNNPAHDAPQVRMVGKIV
jgi:hypothetical protein